MDKGEHEHMVKGIMLAVEHNDQREQKPTYDIPDSIKKYCDRDIPIKIEMLIEKLLNDK